MHMPADFYGYLGERPFAAAFERVDFSGFQGLECLNITIVTQADAPGHLGADWLELQPTIGSALPPLAAIRITLQDDIVAAVWRDNTNATFAAGALEVQLPMPWPLRQTAMGAQCKLDCWDANSVKVATTTGRHGLANIRVTRSSVLTGFAATVEYYSYVTGDIQRSTRELTSEPPADTLLWGMSLFGNSPNTSSMELTRDVEMAVIDAAAWPQLESQWTVSTKIVERP